MKWRRYPAVSIVTAIDAASDTITITLNKTGRFEKYKTVEVPFGGSIDIRLLVIDTVLKFGRRSFTDPNACFTFEGSQLHKGTPFAPASTPPDIHFHLANYSTPTPAMHSLQAAQSGSLTYANGDPSFELPVQAVTGHYNGTYKFSHPYAHKMVALASKGKVDDIFAYLADDSAIVADEADASSGIDDPADDGTPFVP